MPAHRSNRALALPRPFLSSAALSLFLVTGASSCSGGGSGGGCGDICLGFSASASSFAEGTSALITVELETSVGPIPEDLTLSLVDLGSGSATAGVDYDTLQGVSVTFSAGSDNLDTVSVPINLIADSSVEGADETINLQLSASIQGISIGSATHTVTIVDGDQATIGFSQGQVTTPDESDATYTASIQMDLDPGDTLGVPVSVQVSDQGQGTATAGADFDAFAAQTITFAAGTSSGASVDVSLTVRDDVLPEVSETAILELSDASAGVVLGTNANYVLTITEDDASPDAFLLSMGDDTPGGSLAPLVSGDMRDFGNQVLLSGPGATLRLQLTNGGQSDLAVEPLALSGDVRDFRVQTQLTAFSPQGSPGRNANLASASSAPMPLGQAALSAPVGTAFHYDQPLALALGEQGTVVLDGLIAPSGEVLALDLEQRPLPIASDAELWVDGAVVPGGFDAALAGVSIWSGSVVGREGSRVFLVMTPDHLQGWVQYGEADDHAVFHLVPAQGGSLVVVASDQDFAALSASGGSVPCQGAPLPADRISAPGMNNDPGTAEIGVGITLASGRLAIETDYHLFSLFGDQAAVTTYVTELIAAVATAYERDVQATLEIAYLGVYTTPSDPWSAGDSVGDSSIDLLDEFRANWNANGWPAQADLAHFVSGANLGGGVAYVGVLCSQVFGFGVSANLTGSIDWGTFDGSSGPLTWDFVVVAHELGHNFGASHTQDYCPPLDVCFSNCTGNTGCGRSTLMSYCHLCGSGLANIDLEFHPFNGDIIRGEIAGSCLGAAVLAPGATLGFDVTFEPVDSTGAKAATLLFTHDATNQPSPFRLDLAGTATN